MPKGKNTIEISEEMEDLLCAVGVEQDVNFAKDYTKVKKELLDVMASPHFDEKKFSFKMMAAKYDVPEEKVRALVKTATFQREKQKRIKDAMRDAGGDALGVCYKVLFDQARAGNLKAVEMLLKLSDAYPEKKRAGEDQGGGSQLESMLGKLTAIDGGQ